MRIDVGADCSVVACQIAESSGSQVLDTQTCALATQRFRFEPGRNGLGETVASVYRQSVRWVLPEDGPAGLGARTPFDPFRIIVVATVRAGWVEHCTQESHLTPAQAVPTGVCTGVLGDALSWSSTRPDVTQLTQVVSRALLPAPASGFRADWARP